MPMTRPIALMSILFFCNIAVWVLVLGTFASRPLLLATSALAYLFGLRHAFDADHIAAIDGVTRTLVQRGRRPLTTGLFFSLGHSTVVFALSAIVAVAASSMSARVLALAHAGGTIGSAISASLLLAIAVLNAIIVAQIILRVRRARPSKELGLLDAAPLGGPISRLAQPLLLMAKSSGQMYPIGLLFGLGFDTATEVALLGISAVEGARGLPVFTILVFPLLFTAGMSLVDTADGIFMMRAYGWAIERPERRQYYNLAMTLVSALVALGVGGIEALGMAHGLGARGWLVDRAAGLSADFRALGLLIVASFATAWAAAAIFYRMRALDEPAPQAYSKP
jgi:high-affinity nickel-transport protein